MTLGEPLAAKRGERGLTIGLARSTTTIAHHLSALESSELERLTAPVHGSGNARPLVANLT